MTSISWLSRKRFWKVRRLLTNEQWRLLLYILKERPLARGMQGWRNAGGLIKALDDAGMVEKTGSGGAWERWFPSKTARWYFQFCTGLKCTQINLAAYKAENK
jgi:hypothetical protein